MTETVLLQPQPMQMQFSWISQQIYKYCAYPYYLSPSTISLDELHGTSIYPNIQESQKLFIPIFDNHSATYSEDKKEDYTPIYSTLIDTTIKSTWKKIGSKKGKIGITKKLTLKRIDRSKIIP